MAKKEGYKYVYIPFVIEKGGNIEICNMFNMGDSVPQGINGSNPNLKHTIVEYRAFSDEEIQCMIRDNKKLPRGIKWTDKDYINNFGYKEINQYGEISATYLLKEGGMEKQ